MGKAVEEGSGESLAAEDVGPFVEGEVAGDEGGTAFMTLGEDIEEEFGSGFRERDEAEFVDDEELDSDERLLRAQQVLLVAGLDEFIDQGGGAFPEDAVAILAGGKAKAERQVGFSGAGVADGNDIFSAVDEAAARKIHDQWFVEGGECEKVEGIEALGDGEMRGLDATFDETSFAIDQFHFDEAQQVANMVDTLTGALPGEALIFSQAGRESQFFQMVREQDRGRCRCGGGSGIGDRHRRDGAHGATSVIRWL